MNIRRAYLDLPEAHGGGQLHYRRAGRLGAPTLVLLHQSPSHSAMFAPLMEALADDFEMIAPDTPGFGASDALGSEFSIAAAAAAISEGVGQLQIGPCFWFGHHTGAALALQVAALAPEQVTALALSGPCLLDENLREKLPQLATPVAVGEDGSHLRTLWQRMRAKDESADPMIWQRDTLQAAAAGDAYPQAYAAVAQLDTAAQLQALRCPTLVLAGTEDPLYPQLAAAHALLHNSRCAEIPGGRSYVCEQQPAAVADLLREFFGALHA